MSTRVSGEAVTRIILGGTRKEVIPGSKGIRGVEDMEVVQILIICA